MFKQLEEYNFPEDIKKMSPDDMKLLAWQIREFLIQNVSKTGGHLASNLGVVELTLALHRVFNSPKDKLIWDVGHQTYVHKILTGRMDGFSELRKLGGMSGFPKKETSKYDHYNSGHASSSISFASGIAAARDIKGEDFQVVSIIGDGAFTGGMAYEALNNLGMSDCKMTVILNDNGMSISKNTGGLSDHLARLRTSDKYRKAKRSLKKNLGKVPAIGGILKETMIDARDILKYAFLSGGVVFEELGVTYIGPIDGHNIKDLINALNISKKATGPVLIHVITKKGKGYGYAEKNPGKFHGIGAFDRKTGELLKKGGKSYSKVFGETMVEIASENEKVVAITAAMEDGVGLEEFKAEYPKRFFDVGIAEEHAVTFAGGLAENGCRPCVAIYSTFLQRAYDQIIEDVCLQNVPVVFAIDRAGIVGADGETHNGIFDISYLYPMPGLSIFAPFGEKQLKEALKYAFTMDSPVAIRYPRGSAEDVSLPGEFDGKNKRITEGKDGDILAVGNMLSHAQDAANILREEGLDFGIVNVCVPKGIDSFDNININKNFVVTVEDNVISSGFGENFVCENQLNNEKALIVGWPDDFVEHGSQQELFEKYGLDGKGIAERIKNKFERKA